MAQADNAATAASNPAGLTRVAGEQWVVGTMIGYSDSEFEVKPGTTVAGGDPKNDDSLFAFPSIAYSRPVGEEFRVGFTVTAPLGIRTDYGSTWSGRYMADESSLVFVSLSPVGAWRANEKLSLGATLSFTYSESESQTAVNNVFDPGFPDGSMELEMSGWGVGGGVSALWEHSPRTRFGLGYRFATDTDVDGTPRWKRIGPNLQALLEGAGVFGQKVDLEMELPQVVSGGFYHDYSHDLALMGDFVLVDFSAFGKVDVSVGSVSTTVDADYKDVWVGALGFEYKGFDEYVVAGGVAYVSSPVSDSDRTLGLPWDELWVLGVGLQRQLSPSLRLHANLLLALGGDGKIDQQSTPISGRLVGEYKRRRTLLLDFTLVWDR